MDLPVTTIPLRTDSQGTVRVGNTRVTLDTLIGEFKRGETPESIVENFPSISIAEAYAVIAFYLNQQDAVEAYLTQQRRESDVYVRELIQTYDPNAWKADLMARRDAMRSKHDSTSG